MQADTALKILYARRHSKIQLSLADAVEMLQIADVIVDMIPSQLGVTCRKIYVAGFVEVPVAVLVL